MPFKEVGSIRLFYKLEGVEGRPVLVLAHSIGTDHSLWEPQMPDLLRFFQVLRYDARGHGASDVPAAEYSIEQLGQDVLGLTAALGIERFAFCGLSLGGMVGQWLGARVPNHITALILANTTPLFNPSSNWDARRKAVLAGGMHAIYELAMQRSFSPENFASDDPYVSTIRRTFLTVNPVGYAGCCSAIRDMDHTQLLNQIHAPTLVIGGDRDISTPWAGNGEILAKHIPGAKAVHLSAAHLSNIEQPHSFTSALLDFLLPQSESDPLEQGFQTRRLILGDAHVERAIAATDDFNREFQLLITRYAWGTIWQRPGLDHRTRRLLVLAMMASMGRWEEFRLHIRAALAHGVEHCDIREVLLKVAIYAGVPSANTGFHIVSEELKRSKDS